jgi:hypothetical protein
VYKNEFQVRNGTIAKLLNWKLKLEGCGKVLAYLKKGFMKHLNPVNSLFEQV